MTTSRITSGEELKHRNGEGGLALDLRGMAANYKLPHRSDRARRSHDIEGAGVPDASGGVAPLSRPAVSAASISRVVPDKSRYTNRSVMIWFTHRKRCVCLSREQGL